MHIQTADQTLPGNGLLTQAWIAGDIGSSPSGLGPGEVLRPDADLVLAVAGGDVHLGYVGIREQPGGTPQRGINVLRRNANGLWYERSQIRDFLAVANLDSSVHLCGLAGHADGTLYAIAALSSPDQEPRAYFGLRMAAANA